MSKDEDGGGGAIAGGILGVVTAVLMGLRACSHMGDGAAALRGLSHADDAAHGVTGLSHADDAAHGLRAARSLEASEAVARDRYFGRDPVGDLEFGDLRVEVGPRFPADEAEFKAAGSGDPTSSGKSTGADRAARQKQPDDFLELAGMIARSADVTKDAVRLNESWKPLGKESVRLERVLKSESKATQQEITKLKFISIVPDGEAPFKNVFNVPSTGNAARELKHAAEKFRSLPGGHLIESASEGGDAVKSLVRASHDQEYIVLVGHSEDADGIRYLKCPNGERLKIEDLHQYALEENRALVVLTCHSRDFDLDSEISLIEAFRMCESGHQFVAEASGRGLKQELIVRRMRETMVQMRTRKVATIAAATVLSSGGGVAVVRARFSDPASEQDRRDEDLDRARAVLRKLREGRRL